LYNKVPIRKHGQPSYSNTTVYSARRFWCDIIALAYDLLGALNDDDGVSFDTIIGVPEDDIIIDVVEGFGTEVAENVLYNGVSTIDVGFHF